MNLLGKHSALLLLDFDGPICDVFHGYPAHVIAEELHQLAVGARVNIGASTDPMQVLSSAYTSPAVFPLIEDAFVRSELKAVDSAQWTSGAKQLLARAVREGTPVAIVSNNSSEAIESFLGDLYPRDGIDAIFGRPYREPSLMKPSPYLLNTALASFGVEPSQACFIGDSSSDIEAARAAGVSIVALANKPGKRERFEGQADIVIDSMLELT